MVGVGGDFLIPAPRMPKETFVVDPRSENCCLAPQLNHEGTTVVEVRRR